jgi:hypothetical protein
MGGSGELFLGCLHLSSTDSFTSSGLQGIDCWLLLTTSNLRQKLKLVSLLGVITTVGLHGQQSATDL